MNEEHNQVNIETESTEAPTATDVKKPEKKSSIISDLFDYIEIFAFSVCAVIMAFTFIFRVCQVNGNSMFDTLKDGEIIITSDIAYKPQHGDIITFHETGNYNEALVKRVIATEGEWYKIEYVREIQGDFTKMIVYVGDSEDLGEDDIIEEDYIDYYDISHFRTNNGNADFESQYDTSYVKPTVTGQVPEGQVFVMGDNRYVSADSRIIGCVDVRTILGKAIFRIKPFTFFIGDNNAG